MTQSFRWLHLTDLHWGHKKLDHEWSKFEKLFYSDMEWVLDRKVKNKIDAVFFTGDLVNHGKWEQYEELNEKLEKLWKWFNDRGENPWFLAVPGNHDLERPDSKKKGFSILQQMQRNDIEDNAFWERRDYLDSHALLDDAFQNYRKWWENLPKIVRKPEIIRNGFFPGEFSATLKKDDLRIGILGLNSGAFHFADGTEPGHIKMHPTQLVAACTKEYTQWLDSHRACFLLTHHPPSWLSPKSLNHYHEMYQPGYFVAHLFGHVHEHHARHHIVDGSKEGRRLVTGLSLFGKEGWTGKKDEEKARFGYSFGSLSIAENEGQFRMWPRQCRFLIQSKKWRMIQAEDWDYDVDADDEGTYTAQTSILPQKPLDSSLFEYAGPEIDKLVSSKSDQLESENQEPSGNLLPTLLERKIGNALNDILKLPCFSCLWPYWQEELHSGAPWGETMVFKVNFLDAMSALTTSLHKVRPKDAFQNQPDQSKKMLEQIQEIPCWLVLTAQDPGWQPKIPKTAPKEFHELVMFIPGIYSLSIEVGVTRLRLESDKKGKALPAKFVFDKDAIQKFKVPGALELETPPLKVPDRLDYLNKIKRSLFRAVCPDEEQEFLYEKIEGGSQLKPFSTDMNRRLRTELISTFKKDWLVTPFLMINPLTSPLMEFPPEVIKQLKEDLNPPELNSDIDPIHIVCLHGEGEMWKEGIDEESVFVELKRFYKELNQAYQSLEQ